MPGNHFAAVGVNDAAVSADGRTWVNGGPIYSGSSPIECITWSATHQKFVAIPAGTNQPALHSADGVTWVTNAGSSAHLDSIRGIAHAPELSLFVAVGDAGRVARSTDGISWTSINALPYSEDYRSVAWSASVGRFVAVGLGSSALTWSADGITWSPVSQNAGAANYFTVVYIPTLDHFAAIGNNIATSPDGDVWTRRHSVSSDQRDLRGSAYSPDLNVTVAVGDQGFVRSVDGGLTWIEGDRVFGRDYRSVAWSDQLGIFAAVGEYLTAYSTDGVNWTEQSNTGRLLATAWAPPTNRPPLAPTLLGPADGAVLDQATAQRFSWQPNDPDAGDTQSAYEIRYRRTD